MSVADYERLRQEPELPSLQSFDSQPISLLLFYADPETVDVAGDAYRQLSIFQQLSPDHVANVYNESAQQGYVTALQPHRLITFECRVRGDQAAGHATYELDNNIHVTIDYTAVRTGEQWRVQRLELPAWRLRSVRQSDGRWIAEGGVPQRPPVNLAQINQHWRRVDVGLVRYLVWAGLVDGRPVAWINGQMIDVPVDADADMALAALVEAVRELRKGEYKPVGHSALARLVLRVDRDYPCGALRSLMMAATQAGLKHISLAAEVIPATTPEGQPHQMRWRRNFPLGKLTEFPFDFERGNRQPPVPRLPLYVELRADKQGNLDRRLLDRNATGSTPDLVEAVIAELSSGDTKASREIRIYYDNHLRFGEILPVLVALARELELVRAVSSEENQRVHRVEILTEQYGP